MVCPKCGSALVDENPAGATAKRDAEEVAVREYTEFVPVLKIHNTALIPLVKSLLQSAGIRHFVKNERTHDLIGYPRLSAGGYAPLLGVPEVMVEPSRAEEARELLSGID